MSLQETLNQISTHREIKGQEENTLREIEEAKEVAQKQKDWKSLVKLFWEESLCAQHIAMNEMAKETPDEKKLNEGKKRMKKAALDAHQTIEKHSLDEMLGTSYRFLGRCYTYDGDHDGARNMYLKSIEEIQKLKDKKQILEIKGFLADSLIRIGKVIEGIDLAIQTFDEFENSEDGRKLKEDDYFTWAVWRTGIIPRIVGALKDTKAEFDKDSINEYLEKSEQTLNEKNEKVSWGDPAFTYRRDEISKAKSILGAL
jgi:tetratricopeptide (TPR) repeat protein